VVSAQAGGLHPHPLPPVLSVEGQGESHARWWLTTITPVGIISFLEAWSWTSLGLPLLGCRGKP
jgi:hypothetical protein